MRQIQIGGRKGIYLKGELGNRLTSAVFPNSPPSANHWQWDAVWPDGDSCKGGVYGQGLYVSPAKNLVIAWFSTVMSTDLMQYARQIAMNTPALRWSAGTGDSLLFEPNRRSSGRRWHAAAEPGRYGPKNWA